MSREWRCGAALPVRGSVCLSIRAVLRCAPVYLSTCIDNCTGVAGRFCHPQSSLFFHFGITRIYKNSRSVRFQFLESRDIICFGWEKNKLGVHNVRLCVGLFSVNKLLPRNLVRFSFSTTICLTVKLRLPFRFLSCRKVMS